MKLKKLLALLLVMGMVVSITPLGTLAEGLMGEDSEVSNSLPPSGSETPGEGDGNNPAAPGEGDGNNPAAPGEGDGNNPAAPGEGEGTDPATPGEGDGNNPADPGEGEEVALSEEELPMGDVAQLLLDRLDGMETFEAFWDALQALTEEEWALLEQTLPTEVYAQYLSIAQLEAPVTYAPIYVTEEDEDAPIPFTDVASLLPPVVGNAPLLRGLRMSSMLKTAATQDVQGLELNKTVEKMGDQDRYKITLDAYVTGEYSSDTITTTIPSDIVLVLDESGSMSYTFSTTTSYQYNKYNQRFRDLSYNSSGNLTTELWTEVTPNSNIWVRVAGTRTYNSGNNYVYTFTRQGESTPFYDSENGIPQITFINIGGSTPSIEIYTRTTNTESTTRMEALQDSVRNFVTAVRADNETITEGIGHRIAVVGFSSSGRTIQDLVECTDSGIDTAINGLKAAGSTDSASGMERAKNIIAANRPAPGEKRNQVVIMFTDGVPTKSSTFNKIVANGAISHAKTLKDGGASVYTIGVFPNANADASAIEAYPTNWYESDGWSYDAGDLKSGTAPANRYMHYVSSNAPGATALDNPTSVKTKDGFYLVASNTAELNTIFDQLSQVIENGDPAMRGLDQSTVLKDVLTPYFQLADSEEHIQVYTASCTGGNATSGYTFDTPELYGEATVTQSGNSIEVSGFNYSDNFVGQRTDGSFSGKKLVVEIPIKPIDGFFGGNGVPTNTNASGLYKDGTAQELFEVPSQDVPLRYTLATKNQTIYLGNGASVADLIDWTQSPSPVPNGTNNAFVNLKFTIKKGDTSLGTYTVPNYASGYTQLSERVFPEDCTDYTISYQVEPINEGDYAATGPQDLGATVHVLKPTICTQDAWSDYNGMVDLSKCVDLGTNNANVTWSDGGGHTSIPDVTGAKPTLDASNFTFTHLENPDAPTGTIFNPTSDAHFQIASIQINGKHFQAAGFTFGGNSHRDTDPAHMDGRHFTIHLNRFDLTLSKTVTGSTSHYPQNFIVHVTYGTETYPISFDSNGGTKTIKGLVYGKATQVTATEDQNWSWRYNSLSDSQTVDVSANTVAYGTPPRCIAPVPITITNILANNKWLGGTAYVENHYDLTR